MCIVVLVAGSTIFYWREARASSERTICGAATDAAYSSAKVATTNNLNTEAKSIVVANQTILDAWQAKADAYDKAKAVADAKAEQNNELPQFAELGLKYPDKDFVNDQSTLDKAKADAANSFDSLLKQERDETYGFCLSTKGL